MTTDLAFPKLNARDLEGLDVSLPDAFRGEQNVVFVAFQRRHQTLVDSWVSWLEERAATDPGLRFYELPTIGRLWVPARNMINGGMAAAIKDRVILRRTLTVYGDVRRVTKPLGIKNRSTIVLCLVDAVGMVQWMGEGGFSRETALELAAALDAI